MNILNWQDKIGTIVKLDLEPRKYDSFSQQGKLVFINKLGVLLNIGDSGIFWNWVCIKKITDINTSEEEINRDYKKLQKQAEKELWDEEA